MIPSNGVASAAYFYATEDVNLYDATVQMTDRAYDLVHDVTTRSLEFWINRSDARGEPQWFLNLGCGTGAEAMRLLSVFPTIKIVCVDYSQAMLSLFRTKLLHAYGDESANNRVIFVQADFRDSRWYDQVSANMSLLGVPCRFKAAVSVYALHHLEPEVKSTLYRQVFTLLGPNSLFVNADLYSFGSPWLAQLAQSEEEQWIVQKFSDDGPTSAWTTALIGHQRERLRETWIDHLRKDNCPLTVSAPFISKEGQGATEIELLRRAGFIATEVVARLYQSGVVISEKGI